MISSESNIIANAISTSGCKWQNTFQKHFVKDETRDHESVCEVWFHVLISYQYNK
jgi:hypothetical protein